MMEDQGSAHCPACGRRVTFSNETHTFYKHRVKSKAQARLAPWCAGSGAKVVNLSPPSTPSKGRGPRGPIVDVFVPIEPAPPPVQVPPSRGERSVRAINVGLPESGRRKH